MIDVDTGHERSSKCGRRAHTTLCLSVDTNYSYEQLLIKKNWIEKIMCMPQKCSAQDQGEPAIATAPPT